MFASWKACILMIDILQHGIFHQMFNATGIFRAKSGQFAIGHKAARHAAWPPPLPQGLSTSLGKLPQWIRRLFVRAENFGYVRQDRKERR